MRTVEAVRTGLKARLLFWLSSRLFLPGIENIFAQNCFGHITVHSEIVQVRLNLRKVEVSSRDTL